MSHLSENSNPDGMSKDERADTIRSSILSAVEEAYPGNAELLQAIKESKVTTCDVAHIKREISEYVFEKFSLGDGGDTYRDFIMSIEIDGGGPMCDMCMEFDSLYEIRKDNKLYTACEQCAKENFPYIFE